MNKHRPLLESICGFIVLIAMSIGVYVFLVALETRKKKDPCNDIFAVCSSAGEYRNDCLSNLARRCTK